MINNPIVNAEGLEIYTVPQTETKTWTQWKSFFYDNKPKDKIYVLLDTPTTNREVYMIQPYNRDTDNNYVVGMRIQYSEQYGAFTCNSDYGNNSCTMYEGHRYAIIPILQEVQNDI